MRTSTGPKLSTEHKLFVWELLITGHSNREIASALRERGSPTISPQMLCRYRRDSRAVATRRAALALVQAAGLVVQVATGIEGTKRHSRELRVVERKT